MCDMIPVVQQLSEESLKEALHNVIALKECEMYTYLSRLAVVQQFDVDVVARLLEVAIKCGGILVDHIADLPAADQVPPNVILQLVQTTLDWGAGCYWGCLCELYTGSMDGVADNAFSMSSKRLEVADTTHGIQAESVSSRAFGLVQQAIVAGGGGVQGLCGMPCMQQHLTSSNVCHLLMQAGQRHSIEALCRLPIWLTMRAPSRAVAEQIVESAVQLGVLQWITKHALAWLQESTASMSLSVGEELLKAAGCKLLTEYTDELLIAVCALDAVMDLPVMQRVDAVALARLTDIAINLGELR